VSGPASHPSPLVLVVEDEDDIGRALRALLERNGFRVAVVHDGKAGLRLFHERRPDLVLLDVGLPAMDGWTLLERIRELSDVPVLMLTARHTETEKVRGLRSGADDYLTKPFGNQELLARLDALLRRPRPSAPKPPGAVFAEGDVRIDLGSHLVEVGGRAVGLTPVEFRLLETLLRHRGQVLSPEQLLRLAWRDPSAIGQDRVKFAVLRLRRKLGWADSTDCPIETVRGFGYRLRPPG
jgi:DNA-binding response OmpR family regulator